ncbi:MAG: hypothetical protein AAGA68_08225 [Pseudomonadota bacterium]
MRVSHLPGGRVAAGLVRCRDVGAVIASLTLAATTLGTWLSPALASSPPEIMLSDLLPGNGGDGSAGFVIRGLFEEQIVGASVASAGDVNGDGIDDILIGAPETFVFNGSKGKSFVVFGRRDGVPALFDLTRLLPGQGDGSEGFVLLGPFEWAESGIDVAPAGDVNGDGIDDLLIGTLHNDVLSPYGGEAIVVFGRTTGFPPAFPLSQLFDGQGGDGSEGFVIRGKVDAGDDFGLAVAGACDVNADGLTDLLVTAPGAERVNRDRVRPGLLFVLFGRAQPFPAEVWAERLFPYRGGDGSEGFVLVGPSDFDLLGDDAACAGDVNGDGIDDIAVAAANSNVDLPGREGEGKGFVVFGRDEGFPAVIDALDLFGFRGGDGSAGFVFHGRTSDGEAIRRVAPAGDANGDGVVDLLFSSSKVDFDLGEAYLVFGSADGLPADIFADRLRPGVGDGSVGVILRRRTGGRGEALPPFLGSGIASGDVNGDGISDVIIGASGEDHGSLRDAGITFVAYGREDWPALAPLEDLFEAEGGDGTEGFVLLGNDPQDFSGTSVGFGDFNGDGAGDLLIGARGARRGAEDAAGEVYVWFGEEGVAGTAPRP